MTGEGAPREVWVLKPSDYPGQTADTVTFSNMAKSDRQMTAAEVIVEHPDGRRRWLKDRNGNRTEGGWHMPEPEKKPNRREQAKARTKAKILAAATTMFAAEGGYAKATIREIAKAAGMSTGAFFASYPDKETVYREIYGHYPISPEQGRRLLQAQTMGEQANTPNFLLWIADRLVKVHGDNENADFIHSLRARAAAGAACIIEIQS